MDAVEAVEALHRTAALWLVSESGLEPVVRAACDALVAGVDGDNLAALAGVSVHATEFDADADELIHAALAEQGRPLPERFSAAAQEAALVAMASEAVQGRWVPRELAAWAHRVIGHGGAAIAQPLVVLDDEYDCIEYTNQRVEDLDAEVLAFARDVVARS